MVPLQVGEAVEWAESAISNRFVLASVVVVIGFVVGYLIGKLSRRALKAADVGDAVEGTSFERTAQSLGTSTVDIISRLSSWFVYGFAILVAVYVAGLNAALFWAVIVQMVPQLFVAVLVLVVGFVVADKAELVVSERLRGVKLPEVSFVSRIVKYSVLYVAALVSLSQLGVATSALIVLLFVYFFGIVVFGVVALWDFLRSGAAGVYLLLEQPYSIGDRVRIGESEGVVQEVDLFVTRVEDDDMEYVVPNRKVLREGVARQR
ncbi:mechanosensitive ion channel domain-containing protein [Halorubellus sp. PRR65]|uniref:mechanosensitive ion channel domain-containing protein n=1 Tax=Halorubellus sp. PRR65 TaxID=3098148 RepID=UPI002B2580F5|nr:mechanosensitive ion channel domain-containing protein [Halorubellus sp. PRR65]